ncbi:uncharacterized protein MONBRDRAFT_16520 [Monosiga brevicollis MX1]|uniref:Endonuclease V n=1 Tax=Monosiga brevicollis TaxID=81824 RepID=A9UWL7_MONBE|nr:uncharacterized protein MONBRDRAFT_16520 [Monosiga brevicollis MX1]EDQ90068.1 predicted protein [Monosiga brevicollis MX1]|eukprot:XP_001744835.1 hypothetical protein [Monosiga brevicollis MX1]
MATAAAGEELAVTAELSQLRHWEQEQDTLKKRMVERDQHNEWTLESLKRVGGVDISFIKGDNINACATLVVLSYPDLQVLHEESMMVQLTAPYIPGFLAFREVDHLVTLVRRLEASRPDLMPQLIMVDGNGKLHYRGFGLACHLGVLLDLPTVGIGKNILVVDNLDKESFHAKERAELQHRGDWIPVVGASQTVWGAAVRCVEAAINPVYVSVGHRVSLDTAIKLALATAKHKIPEAVRMADQLSRLFLRKRAGTQ